MEKHNYIVIQGWMVTDLGLKNTELVVFAVIYGFCQDGEHKFNGSLKYLQDWTGSSKNTVIKALKSLQDKNMIVKTEESIRNIKYFSYSIHPGVVQKLVGGGAETEPNNIDNNIYTSSNLNIDNIKKDIINYLNILLGAKFSPTSSKTVRLLDARLREGFTLEDFKTVIDSKYKEWKGTDWERFLRPETLFGTKFEGYLQYAKLHQPKKPLEREVPKEPPAPEMSDEEWIAMMEGTNDV